jgi:hypothetical protein
MLRSMLVGLAIAALLQVGSHFSAPVSAPSFSSTHVNWVAVQASAIDRLVSFGGAFLTR